MFLFPPDPLPSNDYYEFRRHSYDYPSYDAQRYPDMRLGIPLMSPSPGMLDFRTQRFIHDWAPYAPTAPPAPPASNQLGMTLNSVPVFAHMGMYSG